MTSQVMDAGRRPANHPCTFNPQEMSMSLASSPRFLRNVLLADALSCLATGGLQVLFTGQLASLLGLPAPLLAATGWFLLVYAAVVGWTALRDPVPRGLVWLFLAGNAGWALACIALLAGSVVAPTGLGMAWVMAQALTVGLLAELQWLGLRRQAIAGWA
jgi:hypothetical protein